MNADELKKTWNELGRKLGYPTKEEIDRLIMQKKETALETLAAKYKRFSIIALVLIFCSGWPFHITEPTKIEGAKYIICGMFALFFAISSSVDYWLYAGVKRIDCYTMSVSEVTKMALYYKKKHLQCIMGMLPYAAVLLGFVAYCYADNFSLLAGMVFGLIAGSAVGYRNYVDFMNQYKTLAD